MAKSTIAPGRPKGSTTFDADLAQAVGTAIRTARTERGVAQEDLAHLAGIERSHMGKIERGLHVPALAALFRIAGALGMSAGELVQGIDEQLESGGE